MEGNVAKPDFKAAKRTLHWWRQPNGKMHADLVGY
jgi:hypothetical protein